MPDPRTRSPLVLVTLLALVCVALALPADAQWDARPDGEAEIDRGLLPADAIDDRFLDGLTWREVGPYRGGRSAAVAGIPQDRQTYYFGATGGGVWKTVDAGRTWANVSDGFYGGSIGAVAVSEWDPNVIYVGGGEKTIRGNVSHGDGMWKSTDAGRTWKYMGLPESRHISRVRIHPRNPDLVYAAVMGHLYGPNEERGVYRSKDGGETWERIHFVDPQAGAVDLIMDPTNPRILYASFWRVLRTPYSMESGGEGSGLWKSTDGGDTWVELTENPGLPDGVWGISGITVSPTDPDNLYAIIENESGGVFRSRDAGDTWTKVNESRDLRQRAWYYTRIYADPADAESVYVVNVRFHKSKDGGQSFFQIPTPHGDNHDLWIDPADPLRMIEANDGGANVTDDGGETWSTQANQPTAQMYRVSVDNAFPYRLLGGQQDNSAVRIRSASAFGGSIGVRDWEPTAGGESGHIVADPDDPDIVYGGSYGGYLVRYDHSTGERRAVNVWPDDPMGAGVGAQKYRFQWNFPLFFSPHDSDRLYAAANVLFRSDDEGQSWTPISPDLTRADPEKLGSSGGPITKDNTGVEYYATIFAAAVSPHERGVIWAGSDDGLVQITRNDGDTWRNVTPPNLPEWSLINSIEVHPTEPGGLYVAATRYKLDDFAPYLYKTTDYGATWTEITDGIEDDHFTRVIRADPDRPGLLYAGTERGVYVSFDDGASWRSLQLELPIVPVTDMAVHEHDLIVATQGRGYWILDELAVLHQLTREVIDGSHHFYRPAPVYRVPPAGGWGGGGNAGTHPFTGVVFHYLLDEIDEIDEIDENGPLTLEIMEADGSPLRTYTRKPAESGGGDDLALLDAEPGLNRFVWNTEYPGAESFPGLILWNRNLDGPRAIPGTYRARLTVGDWTAEESFEILPDPRSSSTIAELAAQRDFLLQVVDTLTGVHREIGRIRDVREQVETLNRRLRERREAPEVRETGEALVESLSEIEKALYQTKNQSAQDPLNYPIRLNDKLAGLLGLAAVGDFEPTDQMIEVRDELTVAIERELETLVGLWREDLAELNRQAREAGVDAVLLAPFEPFEDDDEDTITEGETFQ